MPSLRRATLFRFVFLMLIAASALGFAQVPEPRIEPIYDPEVKPAQRLGSPLPPSLPDSPGGANGPTGVTTTPGRGQAAVVDPPPPMVQLQIRTPSYIPVGKPVPYKISVANNSTAKALRVKVRMPWPEGASAVLKCEPASDKMPAIPAAGLGKIENLEWTIGDLNRGESKAIELTFQPGPEATKVIGTAYIAFEYGARVQTNIEKPKIAVKKTASPQVSVGELATVRVEVTNPGTVAIAKVELMEQAPLEAEFRGDADSTPTDNPGQRKWALGTLEPGQSKIVTYQLLARKPGDMKTATFVSSGERGLEPGAADSSTKVLVAGLKLDFTGPAQVQPRSPAKYTATVRNTGTLPLGNVRLAIDVPEGLEVTKVTRGCQEDRGQRIWTIPKLAPGEAFDYIIQVEPEAGAAGKKSLKASLRDGRNSVEPQSMEAVSEFVGRADLSWKPTFDKGTVGVSRQGTITVNVKNHGAETDKDVKLKITLPPEVRYVESDPNKANIDGTTLIFPPHSLAPGKSMTFTVVYEGKMSGTARFLLSLEGQSHGGKPVTKEADVLIQK